MGQSNSTPETPQSTLDTTTGTEAHPSFSTRYSSKAPRPKDRGTIHLPQSWDAYTKVFLTSIHSSHGEEMSISDLAGIDPTLEIITDREKLIVLNTQAIDQMNPTRICVPTSHSENANGWFLPEFIRNFQTSQDSCTATDFDHHSSDYYFSVLRYARQIAAGLEYLHRHDFVHTCFSSDSIVIQDDYAMVILASVSLTAPSQSPHPIDHKPANYDTTRDRSFNAHFMSLQELQTGNTTPGDNIYSFGIILFHMLCRKLPYANGLDDKVGIHQNLIKDVEFAYPASVWPVLHPNSDAVPMPGVLLIQACTLKNPTTRPGISKIIELLSIWESNGMFNGAIPSDWISLTPACLVLDSIFLLAESTPLEMALLLERGLPNINLDVAKIYKLGLNGAKLLTSPRHFWASWVLDSREDAKKTKASTYPTNVGNHWSIDTNQSNTKEAHTSGFDHYSSPTFSFMRENFGCEDAVYDVMAWLTKYTSQTYLTNWPVLWFMCWNRIKQQQYRSAYLLIQFLIQSHKKQRAPLSGVSNFLWFLSAVLEDADPKYATNLNPQVDNVVTSGKTGLISKNSHDSTTIYFCIENFVEDLKEIDNLFSESNGKGCADFINQMEYALSLYREIFSREIPKDTLRMFQHTSIKGGRSHQLNMGNTSIAFQHSTPSAYKHKLFRALLKQLDMPQGSFYDVLEEDECKIETALSSTNLLDLLKSGHIGVALLVSKQALLRPEAKIPGVSYNILDLLSTALVREHPEAASVINGLKEQFIRLKDAPFLCRLLPYMDKIDNHAVRLALFKIAFGYGGCEYAPHLVAYFHILTKTYPDDLNMWYMYVKDCLYHPSKKDDIVELIKMLGLKVAEKEKTKQDPKASMSILNSTNLNQSQRGDSNENFKISIFKSYCFIIGYRLDHYEGIIQSCLPKEILSSAVIKRVGQTPLKESDIYPLSNVHDMDLKVLYAHILLRQSDHNCNQHVLSNIHSFPPWLYPTVYVLLGVGLWNDRANPEHTETGSRFILLGFRFVQDKQFFSELMHHASMVIGNLNTSRASFQSSMEFNNTSEFPRNIRPRMVEDEPSLDVEWALLGQELMKVDETKVERRSDIYALILNTMVQECEKSKEHAYRYWLALYHMLERDDYQHAITFVHNEFSEYERATLSQLETDRWTEIIDMWGSEPMKKVLIRTLFSILHNPWDCGSLFLLYSLWQTHPFLLPIPFKRDPYQLLEKKIQAIASTSSHRNLRASQVLPAQRSAAEPTIDSLGFLKWIRNYAQTNIHNINTTDTIIAWTEYIIYRENPKVLFDLSQSKVAPVVSGVDIGKSSKVGLSTRDRGTIAYSPVVFAIHGFLIERGIGCCSQPNKALGLYRIGTRNGDVLSLFRRGCCCMAGFGTTRNATEAHFWWAKAAKLHHLEACAYLGVSLLDAAIKAEAGDSVTSRQVSLLAARRQEAIAYIREAAFKGQPLAQYWYGKCVGLGYVSGVENREEHVKWWWRLASAQKYVLSADEMRQIASD